MSFPGERAGEPTAAEPLVLRIAKLGGDDPDAYARHMVDHMAESGRGGSPHFAVARAWSRDDVRASFIARLSKPLDEPLWGRAWLLFAPNGRRVVGHLELRGGRVPAEMHRTTLGMGIARAHTAQGHGKRLLEAAIRWARDDAKLAWIDLGVFSTNLPARRLYTKMGFVELGVRRDAFRLDGGPSVDDVEMVLKLR